MTAADALGALMAFMVAGLGFGLIWSIVGRD